METKVEKFLEQNNMTYLYLLLCNLESERLSNLPDHVKNKFDQKISVMSLDHVSNNLIPDFVIEEPIEEIYEEDDYDDFGDDDDE